MFGTVWELVWNCWGTVRELVGNFFGVVSELVHNLFTTVSNTFRNFLGTVLELTKTRKQKVITVVGRYYLFRAQKRQC